MLGGKAPAPATREMSCYVTIDPGLLGLRGLGYFILFILVVLWVYYRLLRSGRRKGLHGRELWKKRFQDRRIQRLRGAKTWAERKRLMEDPFAGRRIAERFVEHRRGQVAGEEKQEWRQKQVGREENGSRSSAHTEDPTSQP